MSLCVEGFESWLIEMETHTFCSDIAHPGGHREMANPAILYFTSSRPPPPDLQKYLWEVPPSSPLSKF